MMQIDWDEKKCTSPMECVKCLDECPQAVLYIYPRDGRKPGKAGGDWAIGALFLSLCTGCNICEDVCPQDAITVSVA